MSVAAADFSFEPSEIAVPPGAEVTVTFDMSRIGESTQVNLTHKLEYRVPTARGKRTEDVTCDTPLHVGRNGKLSLMPDNQERLPLGDQRKA